MKITQEQFNKIIDLLGHAANAEAAHRSRVILDETDPHIEANAQKSLANYLAAVSNLYQSEEYPAVYLQAFNKKDGGSFASRKHGESWVMYIIPIGDIINQLDRDFASVDEDGHVITQPRSTYTGTFEVPSYCRDAIVSNKEIFHTNSTNLSFIMQIMSHPATPIIGAILSLAGVALIASGAGTGLGACMAAAGVILTAGYAATKLVFFKPEGLNSTMSGGLVNANRDTQPAL